MIRLCIESAIGGGSIAIYDDARLVASTSGDGERSRGETLVSGIASLLKANGVDPAAVSTIATSAGPGSYTGIRIGVATGQGLADSLGATLETISMLDAVAIASGLAAPDEFFVVVPVGRGTIALKSYARRNDSIDVSASITAVAGFPDAFDIADGRPIIGCESYLGDAEPGKFVALRMLPAECLGSAAAQNVLATDHALIFTAKPS